MMLLKKFLSLKLFEVDGFGEKGVIKGNYTQADRRKFWEMAEGCGYKMI